MNKKMVLSSALGLAVLIIAIGAAVYVLQITPDIQSSELAVAATIFPLADIAQHIGGDAVHVISVITPGTSEHSSALTPQQLQQLHQARALFHIGHNLDDQLVTRITQALPQLQAVTVDKGIALREFAVQTEVHEEEEHEAEEEHHHDTGIDPHYWLTVPNAIIIAHTMADTLTAIDPTHASEYQRNLATYEAELRALEAELHATARAIPRKEFIAMHNAWSYFADHYGFRLVATYEPVEGQEPALEDLQHLQEIVQQYNVQTFFAEPQKANTAATNLLTKEFGLKISTLDPIGGLPPVASYIALMRANMAALATGSQ